MDASREAVEVYRDVLRQIAVHDASPTMADAAEVLLEGTSQCALDTIVAGAFESPYGERLLDALTRAVLLQPVTA